MASDKHMPDRRRLATDRQPQRLSDACPVTSIPPVARVRPPDANASFATRRLLVDPEAAPIVRRQAVVVAECMMQCVLQLLQMLRDLAELPIKALLDCGDGAAQGGLTAGLRALALRSERDGDRAAIRRVGPTLDLSAALELVEPAPKGRRRKTGLDRELGRRQCPRRVDEVQQSERERLNPALLELLPNQQVDQMKVGEEREERANAGLAIHHVIIGHAFRFTAKWLYLSFVPKRSLCALGLVALAVFAAAGRGATHAAY